jgi:type IV pilus assembly protein PilO
MDKLIERIAKLPLGAKIGIVAGGIALVTLLNLFVFTLPAGPSLMEIERLIKKADAEQDKLDRELGEKKGIANNLNMFRQEKEVLEQRLNEALSELPDEKDIAELLEMFQDRALKAGLQISTIEPQPAQRAEQGFYARIPIPMTVSGNFHEVATFFDSLGRLRRIVNVSDISFDKPTDVNGRVVVNAKFLVTAFMFVQQDAAPLPAKDGKGKKAGGKP